MEHPKRGSTDHRSKSLGPRCFQFCATFVVPKRSPCRPAVVASESGRPVRWCQRGRQTGEKEIEATTGTGLGIGRATTRLLARHGTKVHVADLNASGALWRCEG